MYSNDRYYVLGNSDIYFRVITFRIERTAKLDLFGKSDVPRPKGFDIALYTKAVLN